jgi:hypothetical protein
VFHFYYLLSLFLLIFIVFSFPFSHLFFTLFFASCDFLPQLAWTKKTLLLLIFCGPNSWFINCIVLHLLHLRVFIILYQNNVISLFFFLLRKHELTYFPDCIRSIEHSDKCIQDVDVEDAMYYPERT